VVSLSIQKYLFAMLLKALSCPFPYGVMHVGFEGPISHQWIFFFIFFSSPENYDFDFFLVDISTSEFIHLIFNFCSWPLPFCRSFIYFQFNHSISIYQILYFSIWSLFFLFLFFFFGLFCKSFIGF
jgi:hypothetical protein